MITDLKLPIGIDSFEKIRSEGYYYVDKTGLILDLLNAGGEVNLFTRPRRFGKSLNMNMLKYFFGYGCDGRLFEGLKIAKEKELLEKYMGQFPVIALTLKDIEGSDYASAKKALCSVIGNEALRFRFLLDSERLPDSEKEQYRQLITVGGPGEPPFLMDDETLAGSLYLLSRLLYRHYGQKTIILIDEYDVPLDKAQRLGYYDDMVGIIRRLFGRALKTNENLSFAVLTGCLRIAKESIFTGLNNFSVFSVTDVRYDEHFGFSDREVLELLGNYGLEQKYSLVREWYDGYRFGNADVYCPWDVINYVSLLRADPDALPRAFWINTSGNDILRRFLQMAKLRTRRELERLVDGESVPKKINQELTYRDLYASIDNLWSVLFTTGYLTQRGTADGETWLLSIPNLEIRKIFVDQIMTWFQEDARKDTPKLDAFCEAFAKGDASAVEQLFCGYLQRTISIRDTSVRKNQKESFYHGILLGLLSYREDWDVYSNAESGNGFGDILVETEDQRMGIVIELKCPVDGVLETACEKALAQIEEKGYEKRLRLDGMETILKYGIACRKKECRVRLNPPPSL